MKKIIGLLIIALMVCNPVTRVTTEAAVVRNEEVVSNEIEYLDNGDMIVTTISCHVSGMSTMANYQTKTATKKKEYCTSATGSSELVSSAWSLDDVTSDKSGNTATASVSGTRYFLIVPLETITLTVNLSCSSTGVLS